METRELGTTRYEVSAVGLGIRAPGADRGDVGDEDGRAAVRAALDAGVTFLDTADVAGDGRGERRIRRVLDERGDDPLVATKVGRRLDPHAPEGYDRERLERFVDGSRENLGVRTLDLVQLHRPPTEVYYRPETFRAMDALVESGKVAHYGVSVETVEEAAKAVEYPGVETVQLIFNPFRQRPAERFFEEARKRDVGVIVRVPLASGLLAGAVDADGEFPASARGDFDRDGEAVDAGETLAGVPLREGVAAVDALGPHVPEEMSLAQFALRWILDHDAVSTVVPGSTTPEHVRDNIAAADMAPLTHQQYGAARDVYEAFVADHVHHRW